MNPMTLGDIFDRWFRLIGATWLRNLILASILMLPAAVLFALTLDAGFDHILTGLDGGLEEDAGMILPWVAEFLVWLCAGLVVLALGTVATTAAITITGSAEMSGQQAPWQDTLQRSLGVRFAKLLGVYVLEFLALGLIICVPYALVLAAIAADSIALGFAGGVLIIAGLGVVIWLAVSWAFTVPAIAWEDTGVMDAFRRSWELVRGHWWRTCGILILMSLIVSFAVSLIMTPIYIVVLWDFFRGYFDMLSTMGPDGPDREIARSMLSSFGFGFGLVNALTSLAQIIVTPLYTVVLYFDLRARRGEFPAPA